jgi:hypothetical protein
MVAMCESDPVSLHIYVSLLTLGEKNGQTVVKSRGCGSGKV